MSNNALRVIVSVIAIPIILAASYFGRYFFLLFVLVVALVSFYEFALLARNKNMYANVEIGLLSVLFLVMNAYFVLFDNYNALLIIVAVISILELFRNKNSALMNLGATFIGVFYIGLFSSTLVSLREFYISQPLYYIFGGLIIIAVLVSIWICDSAAYYIGTAFGKHKLFPRVSPNKSWEGAIAGFVFALIAMITSKMLFLDFLSWSSVIGIGLIIGIFGQIGDLIESLFKRDVGVKDSSSLIPGHGGVFDRFDSLIFSAPLILILLELVER